MAIAGQANVLQRVWKVKFSGPDTEGYRDAERGWPRVLKPFAAEAWRRADSGELADEELYACDAQW